HALVTAPFPRCTAYETFAPVLAWGVTLNVLGVYLAARWFGRGSRPVAAGGAMLAGVLFSPLHTTAAHGFMHQLYGTGWLLATAAVAARSRSSRPQLAAAAPLAGGCAASWLAAYNEMAPLIAVTGFAWLLGVGRWHRRLGGWVPALSAVACAAVVAG